MGQRNEKSLEKKKQEAIDLRDKIEHKAQLEGYSPDKTNTWPDALQQRYQRAVNFIEFARWHLGGDRHLDI